MSDLYLTRAQAAAHAQKKYRAFECVQYRAHANQWGFEERALDAGTEFAEMFAEDKDYINHVEITEDAVPLLVVTCFKHEIEDDIPEPLECVPITASLWDNPEAVKRYHATGENLPADTSPKGKSTVASTGKPRMKNAREACLKIYMKHRPIDKQAFVALCVEAGINKNTAGTKHYNFINEGL